MNFFIEFIKSIIFLIFPLLAYSYFDGLNKKEYEPIYKNKHYFISSIIYGIYK